MENLIVSSDEVRQFYNIRVKVSPDGHVSFRKYSKTLNYIPDGLEPVGDANPSQIGSNELKTQKKEQALDVIRSDSLSRSRSSLIDLAYANYTTWHSFVTLTFAENLTDVRDANKRFNTWVTQVRRKKSDFQYIAVPEFQKRGAVHYHLLSNLVCGSDIPAQEKKITRNTDKNKYFELEYYNIPFWKNGFSTAFDLKLTDNRFDVAAYMCKYMYKDIDNRLYSHQKIMHSKSLKVPDIYRLSENDLLNDFIASMFVKYDIASFDFHAKEKFQVSYSQMSVKLSDDDLKRLREFLDYGVIDGKEEADDCRSV